MDPELIMEISGSIAVAISVLAVLWIFRHNNAYATVPKIIAVGLAVYTILHLYIHTNADHLTQVTHLLVDNGFLIITSLINAMNWRRR